MDSNTHLYFPSGQCTSSFLSGFHPLMKLLTPLLNILLYTQTLLSFLCLSFLFAFYKSIPYTVDPEHQ